MRPFYRPGRCFAHVHARNLSVAEAQALAAEITAGDVEKLRRGSQSLTVSENKHRALAEVYQALQ